MPIQNVGTLLENIVLLEAARVLASRTTDRLALVNAFAMPPLSSWRDGAKYEYQVGFTDQVLERVVLLPAGAPTSYSALLQRCLQHDRTQGPSGALLVGLLTLLSKHDVVMWLNDLADPHSHYRKTIAALRDFPSTLAAITKGAPLLEAPSVSDVCYPESFQDMSCALSQWRSESESIGAVIGFLDPNCYNRDAREGPQTSSEDHQAWLESLRQVAVPTFAVHFTAKRNTTELLADLASLHADGANGGYPQSRAFKQPLRRIC